jgi:hypothetical protein
MTTILNEIRMLEAQLRRGELSRAEFDARRETLLKGIEVVDSDFEPLPASPRRPAKPDGSFSAIWLCILICLGVMAFCAGLVWLVLPDLNLALTLGVTILAALSVALLRDIEE